MYAFSQISATAFSIELTVLNFTFAAIAWVSILCLVLQFSGNPIKNIYNQKIKKMTTAVLVWTLARYLRGTWGLFDNEFYNGIIGDLAKYRSSDLIIPMIIILLFVLVEVAPFLIVLDWAFMDMFC